MHHTDVSLYSNRRRQHFATTGPQTLIHTSQGALRGERTESRGEARGSVEGSAESVPRLTRLSSRGSRPGGSPLAFWRWAPRPAPAPCAGLRRGCCPPRWRTATGRGSRCRGPSSSSRCCRCRRARLRRSPCRRTRTSQLESETIMFLVFGKAFQHRYLSTLPPPQSQNSLHEGFFFWGGKTSCFAVSRTLCCFTQQKTITVPNWLKFGSFVKTSKITIAHLFPFGPLLVILRRLIFILLRQVSLYQIYGLRSGTVIAYKDKGQVK